MAREVPVFISYARSDGEKHAQELQLPSLCIPGGSQTRGDDARDDPSRTEPSLGPSAAKADARDCRQSLRQRSAAGALAAARNRTDLPAQEESRSAGNPGWTSLATLPAAMDRGTHQCLVGELPTFGRALRPFADNLWCFFSYRLLHDRLTEGCAIASRTVWRISWSDAWLRVCWGLGPPSGLPEGRRRSSLCRKPNCLPSSSQKSRA
jgi:hypothetical protein